MGIPLHRPNAKTARRLVGTYPDCLVPQNGKEQHARDCPRNAAARRRHGKDVQASGLYRQAPDLAAVVRHLVLHLQDPARPAGPVWAALGEILQREYVEALKEKIR
jgi:hypothetical protein